MQSSWHANRFLAISDVVPLWNETLEAYEEARRSVKHDVYGPCESHTCSLRIRRFSQLEHWCTTQGNGSFFRNRNPGAVEGRTMVESISTLKIVFGFALSSHKTCPSLLMLFRRFLGVLHQNFEQRRQQLLLARKTRYSSWHTGCTVPFAGHILVLSIIVHGCFFREPAS